MEERDKELLRKKLLGWGLSFEEFLPGLDLGRDISFKTGDNGLDLELVKGMDCLTQDLAVALTTCIGDDIFNTNFGFDGLNAMVEEESALLVRERIRVAVIKVLNTDKRIRRIVDVKLEDGQLSLQQAGSRELNVRVSFETVTGEQKSIGLGKVNYG